MRLRRWAATAAIACLCVGVPGGAAFGEDPVRVAVLPVVVHSSESREYLREGIADMLSSRLDQVTGLQVIRIDDPKMATNRAQVALKTGRELEADYVLFGSFTRFGEGASLDMQCLSVVEDEDGNAVRQIFVQSGNIGNVIPDLDDLAGKISRFTVDDYEVRASADEVPAPSPRPESLADLRERVRALEEALRKQGIEVSPAPAKPAQEGLGSAAPASPEGPSSSNRGPASESAGRVAAR